ncbi:MAG: response regulator transcription factor [Oscillospiraceae bacterium]
MSQKVLVVEDDNNIAELLRLYLQKDGFEVSHAADGGKAVEMAREIQPDLVLLDIMLPVMDGWQVCRELRKTMKMPIIMLTAKGETEDKVSGLEMGADDYIVKPFEVKELLARVHAVLRRTGDDGKPKSKKLTFDKSSSTSTLRADRRRQEDRHAAQGDGAAVPLWRRPTASHRNQLLDEVGFDYWRQPHRGRAHQAPARKAEGVSTSGRHTVWGVGYKFARRDVSEEYLFQKLRRDRRHGHVQLPHPRHGVRVSRPQLCHQRIPRQHGLQRRGGQPRRAGARARRRALELGPAYGHQHTCTIYR